MTQQIAIVGAGVMGRTLAWQLLEDAQQTGRSVALTLFDKDPVDHGDAAAYTAAGMLTPYCEVETAETQVFDMGMRALQRWPALAASLGDVGFRQRGSVVVAHANDQADYQRFTQQLRHKLGADMRGEVTELDSAGLQATCPDIAGNFDTGLYIRDEAAVDSGRYMQVIAERLLERGVEWRAECAVRNMIQAAGQAEVTKADGSSEIFDQVVDCRGLDARDAFPDLRGVRGEVLTVHAPEVNIDCLVRLMHPRYRLYLVPREDHTYVLGATQIESDDRGPVTVHSALELLSALYSLHTGFAEARVIKTDANCRPALRDNLPRIVTEGEDGRIMRINGLYRHGYLLAPVLAQEAAAMLVDGGEYEQQIVNA